jgi:hypothetical protein
VTGNPAGPYLPGWPVKIAIFLDDLLPTVGHGVSQGAALGDVDGDGAEEVIVEGNNGPLYVLRGDGSSFYGTVSGKYATLDYDVGAGIPNQSESVDFPLVLGLLGGPSLGDLDGDGTPEVIAGTAGTIKLIDAQAPARQEPGDNQISAWHVATGHLLDTFPRKIEDLMFFGNPTVADLDGDGVPEIVTGSGGGLVHAVNHLGAQPAGWPKFTNQWMIPIPVVGDIDGDGFLEVATASRDGFLTVWNTTGAATTTAVQWAGNRHDRQRTGSLGSGVPAGLVPAGCDAGVYALKVRSVRAQHGSSPGTDKFKLRGTFRLAGNVLAPGSDTAELSLVGAGTVYDATIAGGLPPSNGGFSFSGPVPGAGQLTLKLRTRDGLAYKISASAKGFSAGGSSPPTGTTTFRIGNDCFAVTLPCTASGGGTREVCKPPRH